jgi:hypothetical protein
MRKNFDHFPLDPKRAPAFKPTALPLKCRPYNRGQIKLVACPHTSAPPRMHEPEDTEADVRSQCVSRRANVFQFGMFTESHVGTESLLKRNPFAACCITRALSRPLMVTVERPHVVIWLKGSGPSDGRRHDRQPTAR